MKGSIWLYMLSIFWGAWLLISPSLAQELIVIEAEDYQAQYKAEKRRWLVFEEGATKHDYPDNDLPHVKGASGGKYLELLPDTRTNHNEPLIAGENFSGDAGKMAILTYPVWFEKPGRYYVWARAFSTGTEDNGVHIGLNGRWPESAQRLEFCLGKHQWSWSSSQRVPKNHCGTPSTIWLEVKMPGLHTLAISMREDGFELDKLLLTTDPSYVPKGLGPNPTKQYQQKLTSAVKATPALTRFGKAFDQTNQVSLKKKSGFFEIHQYRKLIRAVSDFDRSEADPVPYYEHKSMQALAVNAAKKNYRNKFAKAVYVHGSKQPSRHAMTLVTLTEVDGESRYQVLLNDRLLGEFTNPETEKDYQEAYFKIPETELKPGDIITVKSMAVTNGKIPEGDGTAYARGRWRGLVLH